MQQLPAPSNNVSTTPVFLPEWLKNSCKKGYGGKGQKQESTCFWDHRGGNSRTGHERNEQNRKKFDTSARPVKLTFASATPVSTLLSKAKQLKKTERFKSVHVSIDMSIENV